jgi:hypothetical protein
MRKLVIRNNDHWYDLYQEDDRYWLLVTMGGIAVYDVTIEMTADEITRWREEGDDFLTNLARDIAKDDQKYRARWTK